MSTQFIHDAYGDKSVDPTCKDEATGILYDFNYGCCIKTPDNDVVWDLKLYNDETDDLLYETKLPSNSITQHLLNIILNGALKLVVV